MRRLRRTLVAALAVLTALTLLPSAPSAFAAEDPVPRALDLSFSPAEGAELPGSAFGVWGTTSWRDVASAPTRRIAILDLGANGFSCGAGSGLLCTLQVLRTLTDHMVARGNTELAVLITGEVGVDTAIDFDPSNDATRTWVPASTVQAMIADGSLLQQSRMGLATIDVYREAARLAPAGPGASPSRAWAITDGGGGFDPTVDSTDVVIAAGLPIDVYTVDTGHGVQCGSYSNSSVDLLATNTGGTCIRQRALSFEQPAEDLYVRAFVTGPQAPFVSAGSQRIGDAGAFNLALPVLSSSDGTGTVSVQVTDSTGGIVLASATRHVRFGGLPTIDLGPTVTVDEGSNRVLDGVKVTSESGLRSVAWTPSAAFADASAVHPTFVATADDGVVPVTFTATSTRGRSAAASADVTVRNVAPTLSAAPRDATIAVGEPVLVDAGVTDPGANDTHTIDIEWGDGAAQSVPVPHGEETLPTQLLPAHAYAQPGLYLIRLSAVDDDGGRSAARQLAIQVADTTAPTFTSTPIDTVVEATGPGGGTLTYATPKATDDSGATPTVTCDPASGSTVPLGRTAVSCTAVDAAGNATPTGFTVDVVDTTAPVLEGLPQDQTLRTGPGGTATPAYTPPSAHDTVDPTVAVACTPPPGTALPVGRHTVTCTATDDSGNTTSGTFVVDVVPGYSFVGFDRPVDKGVWNVVKAGQAVPLKWQVLDADGRPVSSLAAISSVTHVGLSCTTGQAEDPVEVVAAGASPLRYDATAQRFQLNWKVPSATGCYRVVVRLADGTTGTADFKVR